MTRFYTKAMGMVRVGNSNGPRDSILSRSGVDMSKSSRGNLRGSGSKISQIFPSVGGRGRGGQGYM